MRVEALAAACGGIDVRTLQYAVMNIKKTGLLRVTEEPRKVKLFRSESGSKSEICRESNRPRRKRRVKRLSPCDTSGNGQKDLFSLIHAVFGMFLYGF